MTTLNNVGVGMCVGKGSSLSTFLFIHLCPTILVRFVSLINVVQSACPKSVHFEHSNVIEIVQLLWRLKNRMCKFLPIGVINLWNDEMIPNLVSEFNRITFDHFFGKKVKNGKIWVFFPIFDCFFFSPAFRKFISG